MPSRLQLPFLHALLFLSGFAGLGYEIVWARMLSVGLGHEIVAVLAAIAAFFSGMALGAWRLDGPISRSTTPGRWYAACELAIAVWSLALVALIPVVNRLMPALIGAEPSAAWHWTVAFAAPFILLLPATFAMGGTLPALERLTRRLTDGRTIGGLYAANTFGAFAGTLLTTFAVIPLIGVSGTLLILAAVNFICAAGIFAIVPRGQAAAPPAATANASLPIARLYPTMCAAGLIGIGYEVLVVRALSQVMENTVYSFATVLSVYLMGTAAGAWLYQRLGRDHDVRSGLTGLTLIASLACLGGILLLSRAASVYDLLLALFGASFAGAIAAELGTAMMVLILPTAAMGALFSHLAQAASSGNGSLGRALAVNTLGAAAAPLLFGVLALPALGMLATLVAVSVLYLTFIPQMRPRALAPAALMLAAGVALLAVRPDLQFVSVPRGGRLIEHVEGALASVSIVTDAQDNRYLKVNNRFRMGGTASAFSDRRQADIPLLLHSDPKRVLFLGIGTGATFARAADFPGVTADGVELVPEILSLVRHFEPVTGDLSQAKGLRLIAGDARRYVQATPQTYDVVIADLYHPARDGSGALYTAEHFAAIRARLAEGGIFCQWLPLHQLDRATLALITRTFLSVYPDATMHIAHYSLQTPLLALIGGADGLRVAPDRLEERLRDQHPRARLAGQRLDTPNAVLGTFLAGPGDLGTFAGDGPLNTDDQPLVTFRAPSTVYNPLGPPGERLLALLDQFKPSPAQILPSSPPANMADTEQRLSAYWRARDQFLRTGLGIQPTSDVREMAAKVGQPLLDILRTSPDFEPAYTTLLSIGVALARVDRRAANALLADLARASPARGEAQAVLAKLSPPLQ